jgi:hypothetical protein
VAQHYGRTRENWRDATAYVLAQAQSGDAAFFFHPYSLGPYSYYQGRQHGMTLPEVGDQQLEQSLPYRRLWVILYPVSPSDPSVEAMSARLRGEYPIVRDSEFRRVRVLLFDLSKSERVQDRRPPLGVP